MLYSWVNIIDFIFRKKFYCNKGLISTICFPCFADSLVLSIITQVNHPSKPSQLFYWLIKHGKRVTTKIRNLLAAVNILFHCRIKTHKHINHSLNLMFFKQIQSPQNLLFIFHFIPGKLRRLLPFQFFLLSPLNYVMEPISYLLVCI